MDESSLEMEIFGCEDERVSLVRKMAEPTLPWDNPLYDFTADTGKANTLCKSLENEAFTAEIIGPLDVPTGKAPAQLPELDFAKLLAHASTRVASIAKLAPERRRRIQQLISQTMKRAPASLHHSENWEELATACADFCSAALLEI